MSLSLIESKRIDTSPSGPSFASQNVAAPSEGNNIRLQAQSEIRMARGSAVDPTQPVQSESPMVQAIRGLNLGLGAFMKALSEWEKRLAANQPQPSPVPDPAPKPDSQLELMRKLTELIETLTVMVQRLSGVQSKQSQDTPEQDQAGGIDQTGESPAEPPASGPDKSTGKVGDPNAKDKPSAQSNVNPVIGWIGLVSGLLSQAVQIGLIPGGKSDGGGKLEGKL